MATLYHRTKCGFDAPLEPEVGGTGMVLSELPEGCPIPLKTSWLNVGVSHCAACTKTRYRIPVGDPSPQDSTEKENRPMSKKKDENVDPLASLVVPPMPGMEAPPAPEADLAPAGEPDETQVPDEAKQPDAAGEEGSVTKEEPEETAQNPAMPLEEQAPEPPAVPDAVPEVVPEPVPAAPEVALELSVPALPGASQEDSQPATDSQAVAPLPVVNLASVPVAAVGVDQQQAEAAAPPPAADPPPAAVPPVETVAAVPATAPEQPPVSLVPKAAPAPEPPPVGNIFSLESAHAGAKGEEHVDVDAALLQIEGLSGGSSTGGISWHTLETCMRCWRKAYYDFIMGLVGLTFSRALQFGSLYHACLELWYRSGGGRSIDEPCEVVRHAGAPKLAGEVKRLVFAQLQKYGTEEAATWDVRAVEKNTVCWIEPQRINGREVWVPLSCRHDLIVAIKEHGAPSAPAGPVPGGVKVVDHKTTSSMTHDMVKGYAMDGQFLMNALTFLRAGGMAEFGPFTGMIYSLAAKHKRPDLEKSFRRVETVTDDAHLAEFYKQEVKPWATELWRRVHSDRVRGDRNLWPKKHSSCVGRYGCCKYFNVCDVGGSSLLDTLFRVDPDQVLTPDKLQLPPPAAKKQLRGNTKPADMTAKEAKKRQKEGMAASVLQLFCQAAGGWPLFDHRAYLGRGKTQPQVVELLVTNLKTAWESGTTFPFGPDPTGNHYAIDVRERGLGWQFQKPAQNVGEADKDYKKRVSGLSFKGQMTWKQIANIISGEWFSFDNLDPNTAG